MANEAGNGQSVEPPNYSGPYEHWVRGHGRPYAYPPVRHFQERFLTVLAEHVDGRCPAENMYRMSKATSGNRRVTAVVPPLWRGSELTFTPFFVTGSAEVAASDGRDVAAELLPAIDIARMFETGTAGAQAGAVDPRTSRLRTNFPIDPASVHPRVIEQFANSKPFKYEPAAWDPRESLGNDRRRVVIVGVIDHGIPFANSRFRDSTGKTRIEFFWNQAGLPQHDDTLSVPFGTELTRPLINRLVEQFPDEDLLYREAGLMGMETATRNSAFDGLASHGSVVLDILAGRSASDRDDRLDDEIRVIAVQLPNAIAWDTSGFGKDMLMLSAFHYICDRANRMAAAYLGDKNAELPLIVNFSFGFSGGPHDGGSELEAAVGQLVEKRREHAHTAVVLPAGNTFETRMHGSICPGRFADGEFNFKWRIQPNDGTSSYLELWFPVDEEEAVLTHQVELVPPSGPVPGLPDEMRPRIMVGGDAACPGGDRLTIKSVFDTERKVVGQLSADHHRRRRWRVLVALAPTEPRSASDPADCPHPRAEAGTWTVIVRRTDKSKCLKGTIDCWIQRDMDPAFLGSGARQSYLQEVTCDSGHRLPLDAYDPDPIGAFVRRFGSLNGIATHPLFTVVGGYDQFSLKPAKYSSAGPHPADATLGSVSCSAGSERSAFLPGVSGAGIRSRSTTFLVGTSAAAPEFARRVANCFVVAPERDLDRAAKDNYVTLVRDCLIDPKRPVHVARHGWVALKEKRGCPGWRRRNP